MRGQGANSGERGSRDEGNGGGICAASEPPSLATELRAVALCGGDCRAAGDGRRFRGTEESHCGLPPAVGVAQTPASVGSLPAHGTESGTEISEYRADAQTKERVNGEDEDEYTRVGGSREP